MTQLNETLRILADLIAMPSVSCDSNRPVIDYLADILRSFGADVQVQMSPCGDKANVFATMGPLIDGGLVLSGHSDVVPVAEQVWQHEPFQMAESDGLLYGRGTCDMKGFIACTVAMLPKLQAMVAANALPRPIHFAFTYDEEVGCIGGQQLANWLRETGLKPRLCIIGEPTLMKVIEGHKGVCEYTTSFKGLAGHGSAPDKGVNAVEYAVRYVSRLLELRQLLETRAPVDSVFTPPWTTINVGSLKGGMAHNVIADHAQVEWEFRPVQNSDFALVKEEVGSYVANQLLPAMQEVFPQANIETTVIGEVQGLELTDDNEARDICCHLTGNPDASTVAFGTEAGLFQSLGISTVVCGPGSIEQAHKADEFIAISELEKCVQFLNQLIDQYSAA
ncbi:MAG TPA: acetylornithine deacetylase [Oceanospirillaceae bacterium]|nr:acetylornithine deacetylase [Oceanospirillaceae bacterium]